MSTLTSYRLLCFDVYGTLIDWETGILTALEPLTSQIPTSSRPSRSSLLQTYHSLEKAQQAKTPSMPYSELLTTIHPQLASHYSLPTPPPSQSTTFGSSIGSWPAFPDTVAALHILKKHFKLVVLSNVDIASFTLTNSGPLSGIPFDRIVTAQEIGSYKPDIRNFEYMLRTVKEEFGVERGEVLQTAQSQFHDHRPAREVGVKSVWIERVGGTMGNVREGEDVVFEWRFGTLGEMAGEVEREVGAGEEGR